MTTKEALEKVKEFVDFCSQKTSWEGSEITEMLIKVVGNDDGGDVSMDAKITVAFPDFGEESES